jgi:cytoskeleton protein RodZ
MNPSDNHTPPQSTDAPEPSLGSRFRAAREARGLSVADVSASLRAPQGKIEAIEADAFERLGAPVFARGYLLSYARLLGLPPTVADGVLPDGPEPRAQPLHSSVHVPRSRFLLERYARRGAYLVLTASIVAPLIWMASQEQVPVQELGLRSLDAPAGGTDSSALAPFEAVTAVDRPASRGNDADTATAAREDEGDVTVMASLTPFYGQRAPAPRTQESTVPPPSQAAPANERPAPAGGGWQLRLDDASWVEIKGIGGERLEYGLLPAGAVRSWPADSVASVALGNVEGATLTLDGEPVDLAPFKRANVARFTVSSDGRLRPAGN